MTIAPRSWPKFSVEIAGDIWVSAPVRLLSPLSRSLAPEKISTGLTLSKALRLALRVPVTTMALSPASAAGGASAAWAMVNGASEQPEMARAKSALWRVRDIKLGSMVFPHVYVGLLFDLRSLCPTINAPGRM